MPRTKEQPNTIHGPLHPLGLVLLSYLRFYGYRHYEKIAREIDVPGVNRHTIASWVSEQTNTRTTQNTNTFEISNEFFVARQLIRRHSSEKKPTVAINQKHQYFHDVFRTIGSLSQYPRNVTNNGVVYRSTHGIMADTAARLGINRQFLTELSALARFDLKQRGANPNSPYFKAYTHVIRKVAEKKSSIPHLGKTPADSLRLHELAARLEYVGSRKSLKILEQLPQEWLTEIFIDSIPILRKLYESDKTVSPSEFRLLKRLAKGERIESIGKSNEYGVNLSKLLKNLFIHGKPVDVRPNSKKNKK